MSFALTGQISALPLYTYVCACVVPANPMGVRTPTCVHVWSRPTLLVYVHLRVCMCGPGQPYVCTHFLCVGSVPGLPDSGGR